MLDLLSSMLGNVERSQESLSTTTIDNEIVQVVINGNGQVLTITIKDEITDTPTLEAALVDAVNAAILASQKMARDAQADALWLWSLDDEDDDDDWPDADEPDANELTEQ